MSSTCAYTVQQAVLQVPAPGNDKDFVKNGILLIFSTDTELVEAKDSGRQAGFLNPYTESHCSRCCPLSLLQHFTAMTTPRLMAELQTSAFSLLNVCGNINMNIQDVKIYFSV